MRHPLIPALVPENNITRSPREPHVEVMNLQTLDVWLCQEPVGAERYKSLKLPPPLVKSGRGVSAFDFAYFLRSPGAARDGALEAMQVDGLSFVRVARPQQLRGFAPGDAPTQLMIEKHHVIGFHAGTVMRLARLPDGLFYIQQTATLSELADVDPPDWAMHTLALNSDWSIDLGCPATIYFFRNLRSFCGPFTPEQLPGVPQPVARTMAA